MTCKQFIDFCIPYNCNNVSIEETSPNEIWICYNDLGIIKFSTEEKENIIIVPYELKIVDDNLYIVAKDGGFSSSWRDDQRINENDYDTLRKKLIELNTKAKEIEVRKKLEKLKKDFE